MSTTITIEDDVYAHLQRRARVEGLTVAEVISRLVHDEAAARIAAAVAQLRSRGVLSEVSAPPDPIEADFDRSTSRVGRSRRRSSTSVADGSLLLRQQRPRQALRP
jgi:predicted CopG family antitoxin